MITATIMLVVITTLVTFLIVGVQKAKAKEGKVDINIDTLSDFTTTKIEELVPPTVVVETVKIRKPRAKKTDAAPKKTKAVKKSK